MGESQFEGKRALIIEDEQFNIDVLQTMLNKLGIESAVTNSNDDLDKYLITSPELDIVFLDLEMPGRNGYEVMKILKTHPVCKDIPIVAYTTHESHIMEANKAGFHSFLSKPIDRRTFPQQIEQIFNDEPVWGGV